MNDELAKEGAQKNQTTERKSGLGVFVGVILALSLAVGSFVSGLYVGADQYDNEGLKASIFSFFSYDREPTNIDEINLEEFWRVWDILEEKFVSSSSTEQFTTQRRIEGAIKGLVDSYGDPYTLFLPPADSAKFEEDISGNFSGVGMEVGMRDNTLTVIAPLPDTPAKKAGILAGDKIVEIDGASTDKMSIDEAVTRIRGEEGTTVELTLYREGELELLTIPVVRQTIAIPTVDTETRDGVFIIKLYSFNALAEMRMQQAMREFVQSGHDKLLLDLRGNPGGYLQSAISIAGYFLPTGKVVVREDFGGGREEVYRSQGRLIGGSIPEHFVVLIDGGSASASEILAGALKEHGVATLIGETTFGKGSVQELVELPNGSSLKVTIARWLTPNGTSISAGGLEPDMVVEMTAEQRIEGEDPQMEAGIERLIGQ